MIFLTPADAGSQTFKILLIASEIIVPLIVFVGAYLIFKPVFGKKEEEETNPETENEKDQLR